MQARKINILLIADVQNWVFESHCKTLVRLLGHEFKFFIAYRGEEFDENLFDLVYPLEFTLVDCAKIRNTSKYITGIRSHTSWSNYDFQSLAGFLNYFFQKVHVVSRRLKSIFSPVLHNLEYLTHGVDTHFFSNNHQVNGFSGNIRLGWAGNRLTPTKGFDDFIKPLEQLSGVELVYCGYADRNLNREQMLKFYENIDVYICSSITEGNNNPLLEAAAMERAIITTDVGTVPEYLVDGVSAIVVPRRLDAFIVAVERLRDDPGLRIRLGKEARKSVVSKFEWKIHAEAYKQWFYDALENVNHGKGSKGASYSTARDLEFEPASQGSATNDCGIPRLLPKWVGEKVCEILDKGIREVIVFGAGEAGKAFVFGALERGLLIRCIVDRDGSLWGMQIGGVDICGIADAIKQDLKVFFVASFAFASEMSEEIRSRVGDSPDLMIICA